MSCNDVVAFSVTSAHYSPSLEKKLADLCMGKPVAATLIPPPATLLPRIVHFLCEPFGFDESSFAHNVNSILQTMQVCHAL